MKTFRIKEFTLESNKQINDLEIAYQTFGQLNADKSNVIWVFHAISGHTDVLSWWSGLFGKDKLYDPESYFIICANCVGSPHGSTRPIDFNFPQFSIRDHAQTYIALAQELNINSIHTIIGGSFGGYQALEFSYSFKGTISHQILLASSARESAWGIAIHEAQRMALKADTTFGNQGGGLAGLKAARALGMLTYRTSEILIKDQTDSKSNTDGFKASSYMNYHGHKFSEQFDSLCLYYLTKSIDSHNIGRKRGGEINALQKIEIPTLIIGFQTDLLVPIESQRFLARQLPNAFISEIDSPYGHDGFLMEHIKISKEIRKFYKNTKTGNDKRKILKFGGTSLYGEENLNNILDIIKVEKTNSPLALVVSARGDSTDRLIELYNLAKNGEDFTAAFRDFSEYSKKDIEEVSIDDEINELKKVLEAIKLLKSESEMIRNKVLAYGELISAKMISKLLTTSGYQSEIIDARDCLICNKNENKYEVNLLVSKEKTLNKFESIDINSIPVITGYIASNPIGETVTLGRNGSNYSASLFANFLQASEVQNWTDIDGIYSADPSRVASAIKIKKMSYTEANELASFGMNLLHSKTILPLKKSKIPLQIRSTKHPLQKGTTIDQVGGEKGIKAVTSIDNISLVTIEGNRLKQNIGIDARIFTCLQAQNINVKMISQASTENGIGFVISSEDALFAELSLRTEFKHELNSGHISSIDINDDVGIIAIIGRHNFSLEKAISTLRKTGIWMHLISNSISGKNISLVVDKKYLSKAVNLVHNEVYGTIKTLNVFAIGKGKVGSEFINQVIITSDELVKKKRIKIKIIGICDSKKYYLEPRGVSSDWKSKLENGEKYNTLNELIDNINNLYLNNIVIVDNTASSIVSDSYENFMLNNFDIVASNKIFNSGDISNYKNLRKKMKVRGRKFNYETNVGAGLPIINLLNTLHDSSDVIYKVRGIFSGSLSYIFNNFSASDEPIFNHIRKAVELGYAEPDPRKDLRGIDVARKSIILAREIDLNLSLEDVDIQNLIPPPLRNLESIEQFYTKEDGVNNYYAEIKSKLKKDEVLRYVAEIDATKMTLTIELKKINISNPLAQIKNADNYFEVYTKSYRDQPIIIQGKGAGPIVTARGVYSDVIRIA